MSQTEIIISLSLLAVIVIALLGYLIIGARRNARNKEEYRWKPEQDYDVVLRGETPMSPGFPTMIKRNKDNSNKISPDRKNTK